MIVRYGLPVLLTSTQSGDVSSCFTRWRELRVCESSEAGKLEVCPTNKRPADDPSPNGRGPSFREADDGAVLQAGEQA
jgi:hypothetical protein